MSVKFKNNSPQVLSAVESAKKKALAAIGLKSVEVVTDYMKFNYGTPIRHSGALIDDVKAELSQNLTDAVDIGNSLEYAPQVHNGTGQTPARAYLRDAVTENVKLWTDIVRRAFEEEIGR